MKRLVLAMMLAICFCLPSFAESKAKGERFSFEINQMYNSEYSAWGNELTFDYKMFDDSKWHLQLGADYFDSYHQESFTPVLQHSSSHLRASIAHRWQLSYLANVTLEFGAASALIEVEELELASGDVQGFSSFTAGYKIHSKIELQAGVVHDFGVAELEPSTSFTLGLRFTPGAKTHRRSKSKIEKQPDLNDLNKEFGWPNVKVKNALGSGKNTNQSKPVGSDNSKLQQKKQLPVTAPLKPEETSTQITNAMMADKALAPEVVVKEDKPAQQLQSFQQLLNSRPQLRNLNQIYSIQIGTFASPASIPHFLNKHKFTLEDVFLKLTGKYHKLYTGLYVEKASAQQVLKLLQEGGLDGLLVSLPVN